MTRTARLLALLIGLQTRPRFTVQELANEYTVSRRTMLRDLHALSELGVPLIATPGPGGGYALMRSQRLPPLSLTVPEALGILMSYEAFLRYASSPFASESLSAVTKLRATLPPDVLGELDRLRAHVAVITRTRYYAAPLLGDLLRAACEGVHLRVVYESLSGQTERVIFPFGLYASDGFWYCACYDHKRDMNLSLRADRFVSITDAHGYERPSHIPVADWLARVEHEDPHGLPLRASVTARGMKSFILQTLFAPIQPESDGGVIEATIPCAEIEWYAAQLLSAGCEIVIESPPELIAAIRRQAEEIAARYVR